MNAEDGNSFKKESGATQNVKIKAYIAKFWRMDAKHKEMGEGLKRN